MCEAYEEDDEMEERRNAEALNPEEVQKQLLEGKETEEAPTVETDERDSEGKSGGVLGSASSDERFYKDQFRRESEKSSPSKYWLNKDAAAAKKAEEQAEKEEKEKK